jgi:hypothetical protein
LGWFDPKAVAEVEGGFVKRQIDQQRPEIKLITLGAAVKAAEDVFLDVDREVAIFGCGGAVDGTGPSPLGASDEERAIVRLLEDAADGYLSAKGSVIESRHGHGTSSRQSLAAQVVLSVVDEEVPRRLAR